MGIQVVLEPVAPGFLSCAVVTIFFTWRLVCMDSRLKSSRSRRGKVSAGVAREDGPWNRDEKRSLFLMLIGIALWSTDLIHHISPAVIGIGIGLLANSGRGWESWDQEDLKRLNYLPVFFTAARSAWETSWFNEGPSTQ